MCKTGPARIGLAAKLHRPRQDGLYLSRVAAGLDREHDLQPRESHEENDVRAQPLIAVRPSPGRGVGLFAVDGIPAYARILEDVALLSLAQGEDLPQLWEKYRALPVEWKERFDQLSVPSEHGATESAMTQKLEQRGYEAEQARAMARVYTPWQANAFKTEAPDHKWAYAVFPTVARINHSCTPNALAHYRPSMSAQMVYALRAISPGEEIEIAYFDMTMPTADRQKRARSWGFQCTCPACSQAGRFANSEYERQLANIHQCVSVDRVSMSVPRDRNAFVKSTEVAISTALSPEYVGWLVATLPKLYASLATLLQQTNGPRTKVREALETALNWERNVTGASSPSSLQRRKELREFDTG